MCVCVCVLFYGYEENKMRFFFLFFHTHIFVYTFSYHPGVFVLVDFFYAITETSLHAISYLWCSFFFSLSLALSRTLTSLLLVMVNEKMFRIFLLLCSLIVVSLIQIWHIHAHAHYFNVWISSFVFFFFFLFLYLRIKMMQIDSFVCSFFSLSLTSMPLMSAKWTNRTDLRSRSFSSSTYLVMNINEWIITKSGSFHLSLFFRYNCRSNRKRIPIEYI